MRVIFAAIALAAVSATPAFGQSFSGGNVTLIGGVDHASFDTEGGTGFIYGIGAGYDFRSGGAAIGIQLEASDSTTENCSFAICVETGRDLYGGARIGAVVGDGGKTLIYALAGYSNARVHVDGFGGESLDGIRAGLGVEHQAGSNWFFRFEGRYTNYEQGFERWQGIAGVGIRF